MHHASLLETYTINIQCQEMSVSHTNSCVICVSPTCKRFTPHAVTGAALPDKLRGPRKTCIGYEQPPSSPSLGEGEGGRRQIDRAQGGRRQTERQTGLREGGDRQTGIRKGGDRQTGTREGGGDRQTGRREGGG